MKRARHQWHPIAAVLDVDRYVALYQCVICAKRCTLSVSYAYAAELHRTLAFYVGFPRPLRRVRHDSTCRTPKGGAA